MESANILLGNNARDLPERFRVSFSFAGEQRDLVGALAEVVENRLGRGLVFYDNWFLHHLAGGPSDIKLQRIYGEMSDLVVMGISSQYGSKPWTLTECDVIRALSMQLRASGKQQDADRILPLRVGDGDVAGITLFNSIIPDIRDWAPETTAQFIIDRLQYVLPDVSVVATSCPTTVCWPNCPEQLIWSMANHSGARDAFASLLQADTPRRFLPICSPSESGKSHITRQMLANCLGIPGLACGRFDFKGTTGMDAELRAFVQNLGVNLPRPKANANERFGCLLDDLRRRAQPTVLIFDTYEAAGAAQAWVENELLISLVRTPWLRVVVAGQQVPDPVGAAWASTAHPTLRLSSPPPSDWLEYGREYHANLTLVEVELACRLARGKASLLAQLLRP